MKDFSKGFNGVSADMIKAAAEIAKQSARTANEQKQQDAAKMATRYESVRPATNVESGSRPVERMYASMKPTHLNPVGETIASRVAALSEAAAPAKPVTKHEKLSDVSYLLEPKVKMAKPLKKVPADEAVLTDEDKAKLTEILADIDEEGKPRSAGSVFDKDVAKSFSKKPGEGTGHESKKVSTGTVYTKKWKKEKEETSEKNESVEVATEGAVINKIKGFIKKGLEKVGGGTDTDQLKRLQKNMGVEQTGKKPEVKEERDTPGQEHVCAVHVKHAKLGEGKTLFSQHADPDANGNIAWYDVMFAEGIQRVETKDLEILESCTHGNHKKK